MASAGLTSRSLRFGLTGGIGSGKSTVAVVLAQAGATIVDTDLIARHLTLPGGAAIAALTAAFGSDAIGPDGALDRTRMRELVFADPARKRELERILHPLIAAGTEAQASRAQGRAVVFDVPLLAESTTWRGRVDKVLVVDCTEATQTARVMSRSGWTRPAVEAVIAQQATREQRRACADAVIFNDGISRDSLAEQVNALWQRWSGSSAGDRQTSAR